MKKTGTKKKGTLERKLKITLVRSAIGYPKRQRETVRGLGLRRINSQVVREDRPEIQGMIRKIAHLVRVEEVEQ